MNILITGGAGYIGSHATARLLECGHHVFVVDNLSTGFQRLIHPKVQFFQQDIRNSQAVRELIDENLIEAVIHFAAFTSVAESVQFPEKYYENNFGGTLGLLSAIKDSKTVKYFIFSSTAAVYSDPGRAKVTEQSPVLPLTAYGKSKWMSEHAIQDFCASSNLKATILRYFNVAGSHHSGQWGQIGDEHTVLVKRAALAAIGKIPQLEIFGTNYSTPDGTAIRDYIHVEDLADLHLLALQGLSQSQFSGVLNCGYGQGFSVRQVIESMKKISGSDFKTIESAQRQGDLACVVADNSKLLKLFKWQPRYNDLDLICRSAYDWETREMALRKSNDDSKARKV